MHPSTALKGCQPKVQRLPTPAHLHPPGFLAVRMAEGCRPEQLRQPSLGAEGPSRRLHIAGAKECADDLSSPASGSKITQDRRLTHADHPG